MKLPPERLKEGYEMHPRWYPQLVIDFTGPRMEVSYRHDPNRVVAAPDETRPRAKAERKVRGYVLVKEDMAFHAPHARGTYETLPKGDVVELLDPSPGETYELNRLAKENKHYAVVLWRGISRYAPSSCVERVPDSEWHEQQKASHEPT